MATPAGPARGLVGGCFSDLTHRHAGWGRRYLVGRLPRLSIAAVMSFGIALFALGFAASAMCLGLWLVSENHRAPGDGP